MGRCASARDSALLTQNLAPTFFGDAPALAIHDTWRGSMRGVRIPQNLNGDDQFVLGLSVTRLAALLLGLPAAYTILHLSLPAPLQVGAAAIAALCGAAIAWVRPEGRSLLHCGLAAVDSKFAQNLQPEQRSPPAGTPSSTWARGRPR